VEKNLRRKCVEFHGHECPGLAIGFKAALVYVLDCVRNQKIAESLINELADDGLGPRRIANILNEQGIDIKYYQVAYRLKKRYKN